MAIKVYITTSCSLVPPVLDLLDGFGIEYELLDVDHDAAAAHRLREIANGLLSVPTLELDDGTVIIEPNLFKSRIALLHT